MRILVCILFGWLMTVNLFAQQQGDESPKQIRAYPTQSQIKIDGLLDEADWGMAESMQDFVQILPDNRGALSFKTFAKVMYDHSFLYFGVFCEDSIQDYRVSIRRDFDEISQDCIGIIVDGLGDGRVAMSFFANPFGAQKDMMVYDGVDIDGQWDGYWFVKTTRTPQGWYAEFALPWETLRYKHDSTQWRLNIYRRSRATNEISAWSWYPRYVLPYRMQFAGVLDVQPPKRSINLRVQPYVLGGHSQRKENADLTTDQDFRYGLDVKWAPTSRDVIDATYRTDFAQADVDRSFININRSSIFLPERRAFFLENSNLFGEGLKPSGPVGHSMMIIPFFSRKIGIDESGTTVPIDYGLRYVHRSNVLNYGTILMQEDGDTGRQFSINRLSVNMGNQNRLGLLHTYAGSPAGNSHTLSADGLIRMDARNQVKGMISSSLDYDGVRGQAAYAHVEHSSNKLVAFWRQAYIDSHYKPDVGFVSRMDVISTMPGFWLTVKPKWVPKRVLFFEPGIIAEFFHRASTKVLQEYSVTYVPFWFTHINGGYSGLMVTDAYQNIEEPTSLAGILIGNGRYRYTRLVALYSTDPSRILSVNTNSETGGFYNGRLDKANVRLVLRPNARLFVSNGLELLRFTNVGEEDVDATQHLWISENRFAFTPRISLSAFLQYNSALEQFGSNIRFAWEYQPLSFIYLIYNNNTLQSNEVNMRNNSVFLKVSFMKQF
jgi:hypothetical protein